MSVATGSVQFTRAENMPRSVYANNELAGHVTPNDGERTSAIYAQLTRLINYTKLARFQSHCILGYFLLATFQRVSQSVSFAQLNLTFFFNFAGGMSHCKNNQL